MSIPAPPQFLPLPGSPNVEWTQWISMFRNYMLVIDGAKFSDAKQRALLLTCLGVEGNRIFSTLQDTGSDMEDAIQALSDYFMPRVNVVATRYRFRCRRQRVGEPVDSFLSDLRELVVNCEYGSLTESLIRDQIVEKIESNALREKMLMEADLSLDKAVTMARQYEQAVADARLLCNQLPPDTAVHAVKHHQAVERKPTKRFCFRCGAVDHLSFNDQCPAKNATCNKCKKKGHFAKVCRSVGAVTLVEHGDETNRSFKILHTTLSSINRPISCSVKISPVPRFGYAVDSFDISLTVDTGSCVSILPETCIEQIENVKRTSPPNRLQTFTQENIPITAYIATTVSYFDKTIEHGFYITKFHTAILGRDLLQKLSIDILNGSRLVMSSNTVGIVSSESPHKLQQDELPFIPGFAHLVRLKDKTSPVRQKLRRIRFAVCQDVEQELDRMEKMGIIEKIKASEWTSNIVAVRNSYQIMLS